SRSGGNPSRRPRCGSRAWLGKAELDLSGSWPVHGLHLNGREPSMKNTITRFLTSTGALLIAFVALQGSAAAQVTVYSDINFEGNSRTFNGDVANLTEQGFNDAISSIQIPRGEQWQFC